MSPTPPRKRRRLATASDVLTQPFKSPFKTPLKSHATAVPSQSASERSVSTPTVIQPAKIGSPRSSASFQKSNHIPHRSFPTTPIKPLSAFSSLQKKHTSLLGSLASSRSDLETVTQAFKLENSSTDQELERLIKEWTGASRAAAEEVFEVVKKRVDRMGGIEGWREMERDKQSRNKWGWDEEIPATGEGSSDIEDREERETRGEREERKERGGDDSEERRKERHPRDNEAFTMDMMLQSLNIDLAVIGYNKEFQKWID